MVFTRKYKDFEIVTPAGSDYVIIFRPTGELKKRNARALVSDFTSPWQITGNAPNALISPRALTDKVGIGTFTPNAPLHVIGTVKGSLAGGAAAWHIDPTSTGVKIGTTTPTGLEIITDNIIRMSINQTDTRVGIGIENSNVTSILDLTSTTKGFLVPRLTTIQRNAIPVVIPNENISVVITTSTTITVTGSGDTFSNAGIFVGTKVLLANVTGLSPAPNGILDVTAVTATSWSATVPATTGTASAPGTSAFAGPIPEGLEVYDTDLHEMMVYNGTIWQALESFWERNTTNGAIFPRTLTDNVGVGTITPKVKLDVAGITHIEKIESFVNLNATFSITIGSADVFSSVNVSAEISVGDQIRINGETKTLIFISGTLLKVSQKFTATLSGVSGEVKRASLIVRDNNEPHLSVSEDRVFITTEPFLSTNLFLYTGGGLKSKFGFSNINTDIAGGMIYDHTLNTLEILSNGANAIFINSVQHVGIGNFAPRTDLDVTGTLYVKSLSNSTNLGTASSTGLIVTGSGFTGNVFPGDTIQDQSTFQSREVVSVDSNTQLTVDRVFSPNLTSDTIVAFKAIALFEDSNDSVKFVINDIGQAAFGSPTVHPSALVELTSTKLGFLLPRMTTVQRDHIKTTFTITNSEVKVQSNILQIFTAVSGAWTAAGVSSGSFIFLNDSNVPDLNVKHEVDQVFPFEIRILLTRSNVEATEFGNTSILIDPATGLEIFNTTLNEVEVYNGNTWESHGFWKRNNATSSIFPLNLGDKVGIGINNPAHPLDILGAQQTQGKKTAISGTVSSLTFLNNVDLTGTGTSNIVTVTLPSTTGLDNGDLVDVIGSIDGLFDVEQAAISNLTPTGFTYDLGVLTPGGGLSEDIVSKIFTDILLGALTLFSTELAIGDRIGENDVQNYSKVGSIKNNTKLTLFHQFDLLLSGASISRLDPIVFVKDGFGTVRSELSGSFELGIGSSNPLTTLDVFSSNPSVAAFFGGSPLRAIIELTNVREAAIDYSVDGEFRWRAGGFTKTEQSDKISQFRIFDRIQNTAMLSVDRATRYHPFPIVAIDDQGITLGADTSLFQPVYGSQDNLVWYIPFSEQNGATAIATLSGGTVDSIIVRDGFTGYPTIPAVVIDPPGVTATVIATALEGVIATTSTLVGGSGYTAAGELVTLSGGTGTSTATATVVISGGGVVQSVTIVSGGLGYAVSDVITIKGVTSGSQNATFTVASVSGDGSINFAFATIPGSNYVAPPTLGVSGGGGINAVLTAVLLDGKVDSVTITDPGSGYVNPVTVTVTAPGTTATATAVIDGNGKVTAIGVGINGTNYVSIPKVEIATIPGITVFDRSPFGNDGDPIGNVRINNTIGKYGSGFENNSPTAQGFIKRLTTPSLNFNDVVSCEAWIFPLDDGSDPIISCDNGGKGFGWFRGDVGGLITLFRGASGVSSSGQQGFVPLNEWSHVAFTMERSNKIVKIYINGKKVHDLAIFGDINWDLPTQWEIGGSFNGGPSFHGKIAEPKVYHRRLADSEIFTSYLRGNNSLSLGTITADKFRIISTSTSSVPLFTVVDGNVGIETETPRARLEIKGGGTTTISGTVQSHIIDIATIKGETLDQVVFVAHASSPGLFTTDERINIEGTVNYDVVGVTIDEAFPTGFDYGIVNPSSILETAVGSIGGNTINLKGTNTLFTTELQVGDTIRSSDGQHRKVVTITNDTTLTTDFPFNPPLTIGSSLVVATDILLLKDSTNTQLALINSTGGVSFGPERPVDSAILELDSTTQGFLTPRMTTIQKNAIVERATALQVYDTTRKAPSHYSGVEWRTLEPIGETTTPIFSSLDYPLPSSDVITLTAGVYNTKKSLTVSDRFLIANFQDVLVKSTDEFNVKLTYDGILAAFTNNFLSQFDIRDSNLQFTGAGSSILDVTGTFPGFGSMEFNDVVSEMDNTNGSLGTITNAFIINIINCSFRRFTSGLVIDKHQNFNLDTVEFSPAPTATGPILTFKNRIGGAAIIGTSGFFTRPAQSCFFISPSITGPIQIRTAFNLGAGQFYQKAVPQSFLSTVNDGETVATTSATNDSGDARFGVNNASKIVNGDIVTTTGSDNDAWNVTKYQVFGFTSGSPNNTFKLKNTLTQVVIPFGAGGTVGFVQLFITQFVLGVGVTAPTTGTSVRTSSSNYTASTVRSNPASNSFQLRQEFASPTESGTATADKGDFTGVENLAVTRTFTSVSADGFGIAVFTNSAGITDIQNDDIVVHTGFTDPTYNGTFFVANKTTNTYQAVSVIGGSVVFFASATGDGSAKRLLTRFTSSNHGLAVDTGAQLTSRSYLLGRAVRSIGTEVPSNVFDLSVAFDSGTADGVATATPGPLTAITTITNSDKKWTSGEPVKIIPLTNGSGATGTAVVDGEGVLTGVTIVNQGIGYINNDPLTLEGSESGTWNLDSLDQTDPRVTVSGSLGSPDSKNLVDIRVGTNLQAFTPGTSYGSFNFGTSAPFAVAGQSTELWILINSQTARVRYIGLTPFSGTFFMGVRINTNSNNDYSISVQKNDTTLPDESGLINISKATRIVIGGDVTAVFGDEFEPIIKANNATGSIVATNLSFKIQ